MSEPSLNGPGQWAREFAVSPCDLDATLRGGQSFLWRRSPEGWEAVVFGRWVRVEATAAGLQAETCEDPGDWQWLIRYLGLGEDLNAIVRSFPADPPLAAAVAACPGLRLLRQDPWECLAGFICSTCKQIAQIERCVGALTDRFGALVSTPPGRSPLRAFPTPACLAAATGADLRACALGFRAERLLTAAQTVADGRLDLSALGALPTPQAREALQRLPGVGPKVADCVMLFAYGRQDAFPIDVWVNAALSRFYFPQGRPGPAALRDFVAGHFGPNAGYAQQYLFHYVRLLAGRMGGRRSPEVKTDPTAVAAGRAPPAAAPFRSARPAAPTAPRKGAPGSQRKPGRH